MPRDLTKEEIMGYPNMNVGELKKFLAENNIPDDAKILIQRVEDVYFDKNNWGVYRKEGEATQSLRHMCSKLKSVDITEDDIKNSMEQYHPAWWACTYKDDNDLLFIDLHY